MKTNHVLIDLSSIEWPVLAAEVHYQSSQLAKRLKITPRKLQREFQRQFHTTPRKFLAQTRAGAIKELARQNVRTKDIRMKLEYKHDSEVCRQFHAAFGTSLKQYRDAVVKGESRKGRRKAGHCEVALVFNKPTLSARL